MALKAGRVGVKPSEVTKGGKIKGGGGGSPYVLPVATATTLGGVKPVTKTEAMTRQVGVDAEGRLYVEPSGGGSGAVIKGVLDPTSLIGDNGDIYLKYLDASDYTFVDLVDSNGVNDKIILADQIINTVTEFEIKFRLKSTDVNNAGIFGAFSGNKQTDVLATGGNIYLQVGGVNVSIPIDTNAHIFKATSSQFIIDDEVKTGVPNWNNTVIAVPWLYHINNDGNYANQCEVDYLKMWNDEKLVANLVPAMGSANKPGFYNIITGAFYTTETGVFAAGSEITPQPNYSNVIDSFAKVGGLWQQLIGTNVDDIN